MYTIERIKERIKTYEKAGMEMICTQNPGHINL